MRMASLAKYREAGLLLLRVSIGLLFIYLSVPALTAGPSRWVHFGMPIRHLGLHSHLQLWGFLGALVGSIAGVLLIIGLFFRIGLLLALAMTCVHLLTVARGTTGFHALVPGLEMSIILVSLLFIGPGKFSVDKV